MAKISSLNKSILYTKGLYKAYILDKNGLLIASPFIDNMVIYTGIDYLLQTGLTNGATQITTWYIGMITAQSNQTTASMTSSSPTLTVGTSVTVSTGQTVTVYGAGTSGVNLVTTVATGTTGTSITLLANAGTTVSNAVVSFGPTFSLSDTMASHVGWTELPSAYVTQTTRPVWTPGTVANGAISAGTATVYNIISSLAGTVYLHGFFVVSDSTLGGMAGTLFSEGVFTQGAIGVQASYQIPNTYTLILS